MLPRYTTSSHCAFHRTEHYSGAYIWPLYAERLGFNRTNESLVPGEHMLSEGGGVRPETTFCCLRDDIRLKTPMSLADL